MKPETKYIITFLNKKGKVKSRVGCNTENTVYYILSNWIFNEYNEYDESSEAIVLNTETRRKKVVPKKIIDKN